MNRHLPKSRLASTDRDALAFLEAATIYNENHQRAIIELVRRLKSAGLWTKMKAIYPLIGGTATTHKWNLKDPRDVDAAFRLTFSGGWTHSSTGAKPNGANAYANTYLAPSSQLNTNSNSLGYYSGTNLAESSTVDAVNMGSFNSSTQAMLVRKETTVFSARMNGNLISYNSNSMTGFIHAVRQSSTVSKIFQNNTELISGNSGGTLPTVNIYIGNLNLSGFGAYPDGWALNDFRLAYIGDGLTDTDATNLYNIVDLYQKRLGRAV